MTTTFCPRLQRAPITAPGITWLKCQIRVPAPTVAPSSTYADSWIVADGDIAADAARARVTVRPPRPSGRRAVTTAMEPLAGLQARPAPPEPAPATPGGTSPRAVWTAAQGSRHRRRWPPT